MNTTTKTTAKNEAIARIKELVQPGDTVYCILRHCARSGMSRIIDVKVSDKEGGFWHIGYLTAKALGMTWDDRKDGIRVSGCGMDMGFSIVYNLSHALYQDGFDCIGERCPSNDHSNYRKEECPAHHPSGGYALRYSWL